MNELLQLENFSVEFKIKRGIGRAVDNVSIDVRKDENFGLVGESGCGKTTLCKAIIQLLPGNGRIASGSAMFQGRDLVSLSKAEISKVRWKSISMIAQSAMNALDPVYRVEDQIIEAILHHTNATRAKALERTRELFNLVGLPQSAIGRYPHQFSGGMRQRAIIAMALALDPQLIIADEPTTALDVIVQAQILRRINELRSRIKGSMIMITHDISVVAETCDRVAVMYGGNIVEQGGVHQVLLEPFHPYTLGLRNAFPSITGARTELVSIPGSPPDIFDPPPGCKFEDRCPFRVDRCAQEQPLPEQVGPDHYTACHRLEDHELMKRAAVERKTWQGTKAAKRLEIQGGYSGRPTQQKETQGGEPA